MAIEGEGNWIDGKLFFFQLVDFFWQWLIYMFAQANESLQVSLPKSFLYSGRNIENQDVHQLVLTICASLAPSFS